MKKMVGSKMSASVDGVHAKSNAAYRMANHSISLVAGVMTRLEVLERKVFELQRAFNENMMRLDDAVARRGGAE